jgi:hypothetical protein
MRTLHESHELESQIEEARLFRAPDLAAAILSFLADAPESLVKASFEKYPSFVLASPKTELEVIPDAGTRGTAIGCDAVGVAAGIVAEGAVRPGMGAPGRCEPFAGVGTTDIEAGGDR